MSMPPPFLPNVDLAFEIDGVKLFRLADQLRHVPGDEVLMLHRKDGQFDADHGARLPGPQAGGVHHVFRTNVAVIRNHVPRSIRTRLKIDHRVWRTISAAADLRGLGIGVGHAIGST